MDTLADIIRKATTVGDRKLSNRAIATLTDVAPETINRIMRDEGNPDVETLDKIADALELPRAQLRTAANRPRGETGPYEPPEESRLLSARQRAALDELIRSFVSSSAIPHETTPLRPVPDSAAPDPAAQDVAEEAALEAAITAHSTGRAAARVGESVGGRIRDQHDAHAEQANNEVDDQAGEESQDTGDENQDEGTQNK